MAVREALETFSDCGRILHAMWGTPGHVEEAYETCRRVAKSPVPGITHSPIGTEPRYVNIFPRSPSEWLFTPPGPTPAPDYEYVHSIQHKAGLSPLMGKAMMQCYHIAVAMTVSQRVGIIPVLRFLRYPKMEKRVTRGTGLHFDYSLFTLTLCDNMYKDKGSEVFLGELSALMGLGHPTQHRAMGTAARERYAVVVFFVPEDRQTQLTDFASVESLEQIKGPGHFLSSWEPHCRTVDDYYKLTLDKARDPEKYQSVLD